MRRASWLLAGAALLGLAGCGAVGPGADKTPGLPPGLSKHTVDLPSGERTYLAHRPEQAAPASGYPLVVMLHGGFGSAQQAERSYGWDDLADAEGVLVVYPDGLDRTWNAGSCCGRSASGNVDDVGFIGAVVADVANLVRVDASRVYATGMSNGAMMAYRLACETSTFAAIAPVAGDQMVACSARAPASLLHIHGTADTSVPLDGSPGDGVGRVNGPPIEQVVDSWRTTDGCAAFTSITKGVVTTRTATCLDGRGVTLVLVDGAGHQWPGSGSTGSPGADKPSDAFDATRLIWEFFAAHPKP